MEYLRLKVEMLIQQTFNNHNIYHKEAWNHQLMIYQK